MTVSRRKFLERSAIGGIGLLSFNIGGCLRQLTPGDARREGLALRVLSAEQAGVLEAFGETLVPGSAEAGLVYFVDHQLAVPASEQLLMIKYLGVPAPFRPFYVQGLASLNRFAQTRFHSPFASLTTAQATQLVTDLAQGEAEDWIGPSAGLFYLVVRNDAFDVFYGTRAGFAHLDIPYMAHIEPPSRWGD